jgi:hypothetical protein
VEPGDGRKTRLETGREVRLESSPETEKTAVRAAVFFSEAAKSLAEEIFASRNDRLIEYRRVKEGRHRNPPVWKAWRALRVGPRSFFDRKGGEQRRFS